MRTRQIGTTELISTTLAYGCMRIAGTWNPAEVAAEARDRAKACILAAYEAGYRLFDHADIYCRGECERIFGEVLAETPSLRDDVLIATKCGIRGAGDPEPTSPHRYDFSADHIIWSCENSLKNLRAETIDLYQLHRPDLLADGDEIAWAFETLRRQGKARCFGVSNFTIHQAASLQSRLPMPLAVNQVAIHPGDLSTFYDGTLDQCIAMRMTPLAYSPVGGGAYAEGGEPPTGRGDTEKIIATQQALDKVAAARGVSRTAIALAWLMRHPSGIIPIVGSADPDHIRQAATADGIELTREEWYPILVAARGKGLP